MSPKRSREKSAQTKASPAEAAKLSQLFQSEMTKGGLRRLEMIQAAIKCLAESGIENTTFDSVSKALGVRPSHVNYYFKSKDELIYSAIQYVILTAHEVITENLGTPQKSRAAAISAYVSAHLNWLKQYPDHIAVMLLFYYFAGTKPQFRQLQDQVMENGRKRIESLLTLTGSKGRGLTAKARAIQQIMLGALTYAATTSGSLEEGTLQSELERSIRSLF